MTNYVTIQCQDYQGNRWRHIVKENEASSYAESLRKQLPDVTVSIVRKTSAKIRRAWREVYEGR